MQVDRTETQMKEDSFEVNDGKSLNCDSLSLGSSTTEGSKLSRLASGKKIVSLLENILDCITTA